MPKIFSAMRSAKWIASVFWVARQLPAWGLSLAMAGVASTAAAQDGDASESAAQSTPAGAAPAAPGQMVEVAPPSTTSTTTGSYGQTFMPAPGTNLESHLPSSAQS